MVKLEDSTFRSHRARVRIHLAPMFSSPSSNIIKGIHEKLNQLLLKYSTAFNGVILSYRNVKIMEQKARIIYDSPFLHFHVTAEFLCFCPSVGTRLRGKVMKKTPTHLGLLVYGVINATIRDKSGIYNVAEDEEVEFNVKE